MEPDTACIAQCRIKSRRRLASASRDASIVFLCRHFSLSILVRTGGGVGATTIGVLAFFPVRPSRLAACASDQASSVVPPILHLTLPSARRSLRSCADRACCGRHRHPQSRSKWNKALLDNAARPSGALVYSAGRRGAVRRPVRSAQARVGGQYQGAVNAGRPLLLSSDRAAAGVPYR